MGKIIRSTIDFLYVKGNRFSAHKLPMIRPPSGTYYLTYNVTLRQLDSGCLGTNEQNRITKYVYSLYLLVFVFILSLPRAGWYFHKFNRTSSPYLGF